MIGRDHSHRVKLMGGGSERISDAPGVEALIRTALHI